MYKSLIGSNITLYILNMNTIFKIKDLNLIKTYLK